MSSASYEPRESPPPRQKRMRPRHACNLCRARKVRCDPGDNSCSNCELAGMECVTTDPTSGSSRSLDRRRRQSAGVQRPGRSFAGSSPMNPVSSGSLTDLSHHARDTSAESSLARRVAEMERRLQMLDRERAQNGNHSVQGHRGQAQNVSNFMTSGTPIQNSNQQTQFAPTDISGQPHTNQSQGRYGQHQEIGQGVAHEDDEPLQKLSYKSLEGAFHEDNTSFRRKWLGPSSLQVFTQWLDLSSISHGGQALSSLFRFGMRYTEEMEIPFSTMDLHSLPRLPPVQDRNRYVSAYFSSIQTIFHILNADDFSTALGKFDWLSSNQGQEETPLIVPADRSVLACVYAVMSIGIEEENNANTPLGDVYLKTAFSLYAHIVSIPYLSSVQAFLLLAIALKVRNKDGSAWHVVGHAVRGAQSLGLHRSRGQDLIGKDIAELDARVWWTAYCLDKIMGFETGRPSAIDDEDYNQQMPQPYKATSGTDERAIKNLDCFCAVINLAKIQSRISRQLFKFKPTSNSAEILQEIGKLDRSLISWLETVPPDIRPGNDMFCTPEMFSPATFLALQYHQTMSMLHRVSLLLDTNLLQQQISMYCSKMPCFHRLKRGENICVTSARAIVKIWTEDSPGNHWTKFLLRTLTPPLLAIYVLAIFILKHPRGNSVQSDLMLLTNGSQHVENQYILSGQDPGFYSMLGILRDLATQRVVAASGAPFPTPAATTVTSSEEIIQHEAPHGEPDNGNYFPVDNFGYDGTIEEEIWSRVLGNDLSAGILAENPGFNTGYQFFGLPADPYFRPEG